MAAITHATVVAGTNRGDRQVSKNAWNEAHSLTGTACRLLGFDQSGNPLEVPFVTPEMFGAVGDGVTNDYAAIQAAIDNRVAAGGGAVHFQPKTYLCNTALTWSNAPIELIGGGSGIQASGGTILLFPTGLSGAVNPKNGVSGLGSKSAIRNLRIKGSGSVAVSDGNAALGIGSGLLVQANGAYIENVVVQGFEGNGIMVLSGTSSPDVAINANNCHFNNVMAYSNLKNGVATVGLDTNALLFTKLDASSNGQFGVYENGAVGNNVYVDPHFAGNATGPIRFGDLTGGNRVYGAYKEVGTALLVQFDAGGAGQNIVDFARAEATVGDPSNFTITDNTASANNDVTVLGVRRKARFGVDGAEGTVNITSAGDLWVRKSANIQFTDTAVTSHWTINNSGGALLFFTNQNVQANFYSSAAVTFSYNSSGLDLKAGKVLSNNGTTIINGSGVLQAAGFPALTGDVTTSAGSLATTIAAAAVTPAKIAFDGARAKNAANWTGQNLTTATRIHFDSEDFDTSSYHTVQSTVTITIASPGVVTWNAHGLTAGSPVVFTTTGALPTGLTAGTVYYVVSPAANTFSVAATTGGAAINTSGSQSGTHTATQGSRLTVPAGVTYAEVTANVQLNNITSSTLFTVAIYKNGSQLVGNSTTAATVAPSNSVTTGPIAVVAGDYFEMAINVGGGDTSVDMQAVGSYLSLKAIA